MRPANTELPLVCRDREWRPAATTSTTTSAPCQYGPWLAPNEMVTRYGVSVSKHSVDELLGAEAHLGTYVEVRHVLAWASDGEAR